MFENLSKREKTLAMAVFSILPIMVLFFAFMSVTNSYFAKRNEIKTLQRDIDEQKKKQTQGQLADQRLYYYESLSMSGGTKKKDIDNAKAAYEKWIRERVIDQLDMKFGGLKIGKSENVQARSKNGKSTVFQRHPFTLKATGNINQLIDLIHEFEKLDVLHRVTKLSIKPISEGAGSKRKRTTSLALQLDLELVTLPGALADRDFLNSNPKPDFPVEEFRNDIAQRNIFGLKNNPPKFKSISSRYLSVTEGTDVRFTIGITDEDSNDQWKYELLEKSVADAEITPRKKSATFRCSKLTPGEYKFKAKVSDSGLPSKSDEVEFTLVVNKKIPPPPTVAKKTPEPDPPYKHAGQTAVKFVATSADGVQKVYIRDMLTDQRFELAEGDSFQLDDKKWTVMSITNEMVEIEVDGETMKFKVGARLTQPLTS